MLISLKTTLTQKEDQRI